MDVGELSAQRVPPTVCGGNETTKQISSLTWKPYILFMSEVSWLPLFRYIRFGCNPAKTLGISVASREISHLYAKSVSTTSIDQLPRSTKSPLKSRQCDSDGVPVRLRRWRRS